MLSIGLYLPFLRISFPIREPFLLKTVLLWVLLDWNHIWDSRLILHPLHLYFRLMVSIPDSESSNWNWIVLLKRMLPASAIDRKVSLLSALDFTFLYRNFFVPFSTSFVSFIAVWVMNLCFWWTVPLFLRLWCWAYVFGGITPFFRSCFIWWVYYIWQKWKCQA